MTVPTGKERRRLRMIEFVDTHTHLFCEEFLEDREDAVLRAVEAGVRTLCLPCITEESIPQMKDMCMKYPGICHAMIGLHPTELDDDFESVLARMYDELKENRDYIAVGEVGLDLYWDKTYHREQEDALRQQIDWALAYNLPLVIHCREAFDELYAVMCDYRHTSLRGIFHSFTGTASEAAQLMEY